MVKILPALWSAKVFHKRFYPKENSFHYRVFYIVLDMLHEGMFDNRFFSTKKLALLRYKNQDHGDRNNLPAVNWARKIFRDKQIDIDAIRLVTLPRVCGYVFNPVSFWLGFSSGQLSAVICEVNNTFGQTHSYLCYDAVSKRISFDDTYLAPKYFHVSPFYPSSGEYHFRFNCNDNTSFYKIIIHYHDQGRLQLITSMQGQVKTMTRRGIIKEFLRSPLVGLKVISLIHYQALKLFFKKTRFHRLPEQRELKVTEAVKINKN